MIKRREWLLLVVLAAAGTALWCKYSLPRYQAIDLSVSQAQALGIAGKFLKQRYGNAVRGYRTVVSFSVDENTDRYLQKTLGIEGSKRFLKKWHYDLFYWVVRFFKEQQKEEFKVAVSSATGEIIGFNHTIADSEARPLVEEGKARQLAIDFLKTTYGFSAPQYVPHGQEVQKYDNRLDYTFIWQNKDVDIPWDKGTDHGHGKLITKVVVSGGEILALTKDQLEIPDAFSRHIDNLKQTGENLSLVFRILYLGLLTMAILLVVNRKQQVVLRAVVRFYAVLAVVMFVVMVLDVLNNYQNVLFDYPTTQSLANYMVRQFIEGIIGPFFAALMFILPALAGESLRFEVMPQERRCSFLGALLSSFYSRPMASQIFAGYLAAALILGIQAFIFDLGFKYCGVWDELSWVSQASTALVPALTALVVGFQAAFSEEGMFRLFAINMFKKYGAPTAVAVVSAAVIWGFGHTAYEIFPMWFRGLEVSCIGILMGIFYLRFGFLCVIVAHFAIDSFWGSLPYFLKPQWSFDFVSSLAVVGAPLIFGLIAWAINNTSAPQPTKIRLNAQQEFNYGLLRQLCASKTPEERGAFKKDLQRHGWDPVIIERLFDER